MLPAITPPTDNLYKFISLFGLTIFLFAMYNVGIIYDRSAASRMEIEDLKADVVEKLGSPLPEHDDNKVEHFRPGRIALMNASLHHLSQRLVKAIRNREVEFPAGSDLDGRIRKLYIKLEFLSLKLWIYVGVTFFGVLVMIFGFWRWKKREQDLRDKILEIEHGIKEQERQTFVIQTEKTKIAR